MSSDSNRRDAMANRARDWFAGVMTNEVAWFYS